jgi:hypothetical protein
LSFDCLVGLFLVATGYCKYADKILVLPGRVIQNSFSGVRKVGKMVGI